MALMLAVVTLVIARAIPRARLGLGLFAIHDDEDAAEVMGVPTYRYKLIAFGISCALAGTAGGIQALFVSYVTANSTFNITVPLTVILMSVLGGTRHWAGLRSARRSSRYCSMRRRPQIRPWREKRSAAPFSSRPCCSCPTAFSKCCASGSPSAADRRELQIRTGGSRCPTDCKNAAQSGKRSARGRRIGDTKLAHVNRADRFASRSPACTHWTESISTSTRRDTGRARAKRLRQVDADQCHQRTLPRR